MFGLITIFAPDMDNIWGQLLFIFASTIYISPIVGLFVFKKLSKELKIIFYYTIFSSLIGGLMAYSNLRGINNTFYYNTFTLFEFIFLIYAVWINQKNKFYFWIGIFGSIILGIIYIYSFIEHEIIYDNTLRLAEASLLIIISIIYLTRIFGKSFEKYAKDPFKYVIVGIFTYFSSSILILSAGNQTQLFSKEQFIIMFFINSVFYTIMVFLIIISFIKCYRK